jgi:NAD(P)-dependent dehydrogenase (short-subunit alcohol dehydrogenase family)
MARLDGKVAIITGSGRGLGRAIAELFAAEGAKVAVAEISEETGQQAVDAIRSAGGTATFVQLDVTQEPAWSVAVELVTDELGPPDILVSNALTWVLPNALECTVEEWNRVIDVVLHGTFYGIRAVLPGMIERGSGSIVSVASVIGPAVSIPAHGPYHAAKGGMVALTRHIAATFGGQGIRANCLLPGPMYTEGLELSGFTGPAEEIASTFPLGRIGDPREVAAGALFLASDEASYATGVSLPIDGGQIII